MFLDPLSAIHLLSGMSLLSRYKPESCPALPCPALFCLIKSAALVEHMTDSCLVQLEQMTSPTPGISFCLHPLPFFLGLHPSVCLCCSFRSRSSSLPSCIVWSSMFVLRVYVTFKGVRCTAVGRKLLASFQRFHTKATVHMQPGENGKQYHKMSMEKSTQ